jgi:hypothetical protein
VISTRALNNEGLALESALPDQFVDVRVRRNWGAAFGRLFWFAVTVGIGVLAAKFGERWFDLAVIAMRQASGG